MPETERSQPPEDIRAQVGEFVDRYKVQAENTIDPLANAPANETEEQKVQRIATRTRLYNELLKLYNDAVSQASPEFRQRLLENFTGRYNRKFSELYEGSMKTNANLPFDPFAMDSDWRTYEDLNPAEKAAAEQAILNLHGLNTPDLLSRARIGQYETSVQGNANGRPTSPGRITVEVFETPKEVSAEINGQNVTKRMYLERWLYADNDVRYTIGPLNNAVAVVQTAR